MAVTQRDFHCGGRRLDLGAPRVMGIINATPDSFSDGGRLRSGSGSAGFFVSVEKALRQAQAMQQAGAAIVDVGGESTRPGAEPVSIGEEMDRVLPVIEAISRELDVAVSVDSSNAEVIREAAKAGACMVNDVRALQREGATRVVADTKIGVCLMHMQGDPETMQHQPRYNDVVEEVYRFLEQRIEAALEAGIERERLLIDPGFGFGKTMAHNYRLLARLDHFSGLGPPILVGMSRKSMIGNVVDRPVEQRVAGSVAAAVSAVLSGASIVRCHDVAGTVDALRVCTQVLRQRDGAASVDRTREQ